MTQGLRRFMKLPPPLDPAAVVEKCEMCTEVLAEDHPHLVNVESRQILCACRGCYLLFTARNAGKFRAVPERYRYSPELADGIAFWDSIGIPVGMAFFFTSSAQEAPIAFYPSPAGATESLLTMEMWDEVLTANPAFKDVTEDVEALLMRRTESGVECYLVPIDSCYGLVGLVKVNWRGFDGGTEARDKIDAFFENLRGRSDLIPVDGHDG
ncbi:DUF5947 family protein [Fodinicola feengrottensis]|uniref:DUF5947 family protein n=1 Tax=Fodinicola feengrottensis TaxID=435914 RepID=A0ABP4U5C2_9ACTN|nr:DUF5947 family protein [Fodinicola feengrottensis]